MTSNKVKIYSLITLLELVRETFYLILLPHFISVGGVNNPPGVGDGVGPWDFSSEGRGLSHNLQ